MDAMDLLRLDALPGMHGAHCTKCKRLFDAFDTPSQLDEALMRMKTLVCPQCGKRGNLMLLMPWVYREMVAKQVAEEDAREAVRQTADKYIHR